MECTKPHNKTWACQFKHKSACDNVAIIRHARMHHPPRVKAGRTSRTPLYWHWRITQRKRKDETRPATSEKWVVLSWRSIRRDKTFVFRCQCHHLLTSQLYVFSWGAISIPSPIQTFQFVTFILRVRKRSEKLKALFGKK